MFFVPFLEHRFGERKYCDVVLISLPNHGIGFHDT